MASSGGNRQPAAVSTDGSPVGRARIEGHARRSDARSGRGCVRAALETLGGFVAEMLHNESCPQRLQVCDPKLAEYLRSELEETGIEVQLVDQLPELQAIFAEMAEFVDAHGDGPPSLLELRGVTVERVRAFATAAAAFYRAAPWRVSVRYGSHPGRNPETASWNDLLGRAGAGRNMYGLGFYGSRAAHERFSRAGRCQRLWRAPCRWFSARVVRCVGRAAAGGCGAVAPTSIAGGRRPGLPIGVEICCRVSDHPAFQEGIGLFRKGPAGTRGNQRAGDRLRTLVQADFDIRRAGDRDIRDSGLA